MRVPRVGEDFGPYHVDAHLGMGGMGVVLRATDVRLGRTVALKVLSSRLAGSDEFRHRFHREADVLARLDSPHIIAIYDHAELDGCPYLATQYVAGGDLDQLLQAHGGLPPSVATAICAQVAAALGDAHRAGVVHRDVKPSNVLLRDPQAEVPHAYLCDFGIAQTETQGEALTATGSVAGSWAYLAPERTRGAPGTPASDIYALGCVLWATLTGRAPYAGSDAQIAIAHLQAPIPELPGDDPVSRQVNAVLRCALAKDPADRYADAASLRDDLLHIASGRPGPPPTAGAAGHRPGRARVRMLAAALATCLVIGGGAAWIWWPDDKAPASADPPTESEPSGQPSASPDDRPITGDHDGDGYGDLVFKDFRDKKPSYRVVLASTGDRFAAPSRTAWNPWKPPPTSDVLGDFDGDGAVERLTVSADKTPQTIIITPLDAGAGAKPIARKRPVRANCGSTTAGDFDGDGNLDLAMSFGPEKGGGDVWVLPGDGTGVGFGKPKLWLKRITADCSSLYPGDFDGDGQTDLSVADPFSEPGVVLLRLARAVGGRFVLGPATRVPDGSYGSATALVGNFDGDEKSEIALYTPSRTSRDIQVIEARDSRFTQVTSWVVQPGPPPDTWDYSELTVSDVNGDHRDDVIRVGPADGGKGGYPVHVFVSTGSGFDQPKVWGRLSCRRPCDDARDVNLTNSGGA